MPIVYRNGDGNTFLHLAVAHGHVEVAKLILQLFNGNEEEQSSSPATDKGGSPGKSTARTPLLNIDEDNMSEETPLHLAAYYGIACHSGQGRY